MAGMLTPIPHTPLTERLRAEGRLLPSEFSANNVTDAVQFVPRGMTVDEMRAGYDAMLQRLFAPGATHDRSAALLARLQPHVFHARHERRSDLLAAHDRGAHVRFDRDVAALRTLVDHARDAMIRSAPERSLADIAGWAAGLDGRIAAGSLTADDVRSVYTWGHEFFEMQRRLHRFPGAYVEKAFNLAIKGLHYEIVMCGIATASVPHAAHRERPARLH